MFHCARLTREPELLKREVRERIHHKAARVVIVYVGLTHGRARERTEGRARAAAAGWGGSARGTKDRAVRWCGGSRGALDLLSVQGLSMKNADKKWQWRGKKRGGMGTARKMACKCGWGGVF